MTQNTDLTTWTVKELRAEIRRLAATSFSTVGEEQQVYRSVSQWSQRMTPYINEIARRDAAGELTDDDFSYEWGTGE